MRGQYLLTLLFRYEIKVYTLDTVRLNDYNRNSMLTPTSDTTFDWYVNLNGTADVKATFTAEGRKKSCIIKLEEIEKISSLHRKENEDNAHLIKNPIVFTFLHRQHMKVEKNGLPV